MTTSYKGKYCQAIAGDPEDGFNNDGETYNVGFKLVFPSPEDGPSTPITFDFTTYNSGFAETVQNGLMDTVTEQGSDKFYLDRGTDLRENCRNTNITDFDSLKHYTNFAALDVKNFLNENIEQPKTLSVEESAFGIYTEDELAESEYVAKVDEYLLEPMELRNDGIELNAVFTSTKGETIGVQTILE